jgi:hypothetical protein
MAPDGVIRITQRTHATLLKLKRDLDAGLSLKQIAFRDGISVWKLYRRRRLYELLTGELFPRTDGRGRKPSRARAA